MDEYDVIVEKTVRDLFKSSALIQIKKYKMTKEREIQSKNNELKQLILDKYTILINSVDALEEISSHLKELQLIRNQLGIKISSLDFKEIESKLSKINFDENILREDIIEEPYEIEEQFNKGYLFLTEKKYNDIISILRDIKCHNKKLQGFNIDNYEYLKVELTEGLMKELISDSYQIESIDYYYKTFEVIYNELMLHPDNDNKTGFLDKLFLSEFYLKISYDDNITEIYNKYFINSNDKNENDKDKDNNKTTMFGYNLIIRLLILKLSQCFVSLSKSKDNEFTKIDNKKGLIELYLALLSILKTVKEYQNDITYDRNKHMNDFILYIKAEITNNISSLFIISKGVSSLSNSTSSKPVDVIQFWAEIYDQMIQLNKKHELILSAYQINEVNNLIEVLFSEKVIDQISNVIQYRTSFYSFEFFSLNNKSNNITKNNLMKIQPRAINGKKEHELQNLFQTIFSITTPQFSFILKKTIQLLVNQLRDLLAKALAIFNKENDMKDITNSYLDFLIDKFSQYKLPTECNTVDLNQLIDLIASMEEIYLRTNYTKIKEFMLTFENYLFHEMFSSEDIAELAIGTCSDSLKELLLFLQSIEIKQSEYKKMIFNLIYCSYEKQLGLSIQEQILHPKIIADLNLLSKISIRGSNQDNDLEQINFNALIKLSEEKFGFHNAYEEANEVIGKKALNNFFRHENYSQEDVCFPIMSNKMILGVKKEKRELINCGTYHSKLNVYFIDKTIECPSGQKKKSAIQGNSTSKILEHRIDENYLSLKTNKNNLGAINSNTTQSQNTNNFLTGKFFNLKNS